MDTIRVAALYFVRGGERSKGKMVDEKLIDLGEAGDMPIVDFFMGESSLFARHPRVLLNEVQCYVKWKDVKTIRITSITAIRDGDDVFICNSSHHQALEAYLAESRSVNNSSNTTIDQTNPGKRKRENYGNSVSERIEYHIEHRLSSTYNNPRKR